MKSLGITMRVRPMAEPSRRAAKRVLRRRAAALGWHVPPSGYSGSGIQASRSASASRSSASRSRLQPPRGAVLQLRSQAQCGDRGIDRFRIFGRNWLAPTDAPHCSPPWRNRPERCASNYWLRFALFNDRGPAEGAVPAKGSFDARAVATFTGAGRSHDRQVRRAIGVPERHGERVRAPLDNKRLSRRSSPCLTL